MHRHFIKMFITMAVVVLALSIAGLILESFSERQYIFLPEEMAQKENASKKVTDFFFNLLHNIVLLSHAIPMSIYVAIEVLKWF